VRLFGQILSSASLISWYGREDVVGIFCWLGAALKYFQTDAVYRVYYCGLISKFHNYNGLIDTIR
jgi:hypothetical protein